MFDRILKRAQMKVRTKEYLMTLHAEEEMEDDNLTIFDVENAILTGNIIERQKDYDSGEWKYLIQGESLHHGSIVSVIKLSLTGKLIIVTVFTE
jgi:hypothetical protein